MGGRGTRENVLQSGALGHPRHRFRGKREGLTLLSGKDALLLETHRIIPDRQRPGQGEGWKGSAGSQPSGLPLMARGKQ